MHPGQFPLQEAGSRHDKSSRLTQRQPIVGKSAEGGPKGTGVRESRIMICAHHIAATADDHLLFGVLLLKASGVKQVNQALE